MSFHCRIQPSWPGCLDPHSHTEETTQISSKLPTGPETRYLPVPSAWIETQYKVQLVSLVPGGRGEKKRKPVSQETTQALPARSGCNNTEATMVLSSWDHRVRGGGQCGGSRPHGKWHLGCCPGFQGSRR